MHETIIEIINGMLAPGIMISACGLLLLGMNNKYSLVVNRIRTLNTELRQLSGNDLSRKQNILAQVPLLIVRMKLIRNAVWFYTIGIAMFIFSVFSIGVHFLLNQNFVINIFLISFFVIALIAVLLGIFHAAKEVRLGFEILKIETKDILWIKLKIINIFGFLVITITEIIKKPLNYCLMAFYIFLFITNLS